METEGEGDTPDTVWGLECAMGDGVEVLVFILSILGGTECLCGEVKGYEHLRGLGKCT